MAKPGHQHKHTGQGTEDSEYQGLEARTSSLCPWNRKGQHESDRMVIGTMSGRSWILLRLQGAAEQFKPTEHLHLNVSHTEESRF